LTSADYGWTKSTWNQIASAYPYGLTDASLLAQADDIESLTESSVPYIRADWFITNASIAPLYHEILRLPDTLKGTGRPASH
jgi:serine/threonine-protein kinase